MRNLTEHNSSFDELTSTYKRGDFYNLVSNFLFQKPLQGLIMVDIDNLKYINRLKSEEIGDMVITKVARNIYRQLPKKAIVGRTSGDEFTIFLHELSSEKELSQIAEQLVLSQRVPIHHEGEDLLLTLSAGGLLITDRLCDKSHHDIINYAEIAMCKAKEYGKNQFVMFEDHFVEMLNREQNILSCIQKQIAKRDFDVVFQPMFNIKTGELVSFEILCRLKSERYGNIPPEEFIRIAENSNIVNSVDEIVLSKACATLEYIQKNGCHSVGISVNVSPAHIARPSFCDAIIDIIRSYDIDASMLALELTERTLAESMTNTKDIVNKLNAYGIKLYLDDFGIGYSNLSAIADLPLNRLKMDKGLVDRIKADQDNVLIKKTIEIAKLFHLDVVAEGIETQSQLDELKKLDCEIGQGYFLSMPMSFEEVLPFIQNTRMKG